MEACLCQFALASIRLPIAQCTYEELRHAKEAPRELKSESHTETEPRHQTSFSFSESSTPGYTTIAGYEYGTLKPFYMCANMHHVGAAV